MTSLRQSLGLGAVAITSVALLVASCSDEAAGPNAPLIGRFSVAPTFASSAAALIDLDRARFLLIRNADSSVARDTTIGIGADADTVALSLTVPVLTPGETFSLFLYLITPDGDTAFSAGPVEVSPQTSGEPPSIPVELVYTGVGADAVEIVIVESLATVLAGDTILLVAEALDSAGEPIAGTPIAWQSLNPGRATVLDPTEGRVVVGDQRGDARIEASLLTGPTDTATITITLPPNDIVALAGSDQTGAINTALPQQLVARVIAADGQGIPNVWVRFTVATGGGSVSADSVLADSTGRARVTWTLGPNVGSQSVEARTPVLPGDVAMFTATGTSTGPGTVTISAGDNQAGLVGTTLPTPPAVLVQDAQGNPVSGATVTFVASSGGGSVAGATQTTNGSGIATVGGWTLGPAVGTNTLTATVDTLGPVVFTALATGPNGAFSMSIAAGNGQSATVASALPIAPAVTVLDTAGNPAAGVMVAFAVTGGGGSITGDTATTDAQGIAAVGSWTLGPSVGANTLSATVLGLPTVAFTATGTVGAPATVTIAGGNNQSDTAGFALPVPLVVEVVDSSGNPVPGVMVDWTALQGSVSASPTLTDAAGRAQTTWTLGVNAVDQTLTASVAGLTPVVFNATAIFANPSILLALSGTTRIPAGGSAMLDVTLTAPAPTGGIIVTITSDNPAIAAIQSPGTVTIPETGTTAQIGVDGVGGGPTTLRATATGYIDGAAGVIVSVQVLSLPATLNVPFGSTASMPVQISTPAPTGGVAVTLISTDPALVEVLTPTVTIPEGQSTANGTVSGVFPGSATVTGTTTDFGTAQSVVTTTANLNIVQGTQTINATFGGTVNVRLESGGSAIPAPAPGITVTMVTTDPTCLVATSPVTIPTGLVDTLVSFQYGGSATLRCTTYLKATAPNIVPDSILVNVDPAPGINVSGTTVGAGLQRSWSGSLAASNHGGVGVVIRSEDPSVALVSPNATTAGTDSIIIPLANGVTSFGYYVQGVEGIADTGTASVTFTYSAAGFTTATSTKTILRPAVDLAGVIGATTSLSPSDAFQARIGIPNATNAFLTELQAIRIGGTPVTVTMVLADSAVAQLVTSGDTAGTIALQINAGQLATPSSVASGGVAVDPLAAGTTSVSATIPGWVVPPSATAAVTITAPGINTSGVTVGAGLQRSWSGGLGASNHGGVDLVIRSEDPTIALISPNGTTAGSDSIIVSIADGATGFSYYVHGMEGVADTGNASVTFTYLAPGFTTATATKTIVQPALDLSGVITTTTTLTPDDPFQVRIGIPNAANTFLNELQAIRIGGTPVVATVIVSDSAVGRLVTSTDTAGTITLQLDPGQLATPGSVAAGGVALEPLTQGPTTVSASIPGFRTPPPAAVTVNVTAPGINASSLTVGAGLQRSWSGSLGASNHGGVDVVIRSENPSAALVSPNATTPGDDSIVVSLADGFTSFGYHVQGVEGIADTGNAPVTFTYLATGFTTATSTKTVIQPALDLAGVNLTTTTLSPADPFVVRIGIPNAGQNFLQELQAVRAGGVSVTATVTVGTPAVAQLMTTEFTGSSLNFQIDPGQLTTPGSVAAGGVALDPLTAGSTTVTASIPGFVSPPSATVTVNVSAPGINMSPVTVGSGLQRSWSGSLGASNHGGVDVVIKSSAPGVALVSPNTTAAGTDSIIVPVADGTVTFSYFVQGVEGQTGTVTFSATASGFTDGSTTKTIVQPAMDLSGLLTAMTTLNPSDAFQVRIGIPNAAQTFLQELQAVRAGGAPLAATVVVGTPAVGQLVTTADTGSSLDLQIDPGQFATPGSVAAGGVAFDPLTTGTTTVSGTIPGYVVLPTATVSVTVSTPNIIVNPATAGAGLQRSWSGALGASGHGGVTVTITSDDPSVALVSPDAATAGTAQIMVTVPDGNTGFTFFVQGVEGQAGAATFTATAPGFNDGNAVMTVVQPAFDISGLGTNPSAAGTDDPFTVRVGLPNATNAFLSETQAVRAGAPGPLTATVSSSDGAVGQLVTTALTGDVVTVTIAVGSASSPTSVATGGVAFDPLTAGPTTVSAVIGGFVALPTAAVTVTVAP
ncbi:MAG TPA: hypothetical protein VGA37_09840 [Gemmatimonadales bacterium]